MKSHKRKRRTREHVIADLSVRDEKSLVGRNKKNPAVPGRTTGLSYQLVLPPNKECGHDKSQRVLPLQALKSSLERR